MKKMNHVYSAFRFCLKISGLHLFWYYLRKYPSNQLTMVAANAIEKMFRFFAWLSRN